jgi:hypothetical protein
LKESWGERMREAIWRRGESIDPTQGKLFERKDRTF